jgi:hypothetical protein
LEEFHRILFRLALREARVGFSDDFIVLRGVQLSMKMRDGRVGLLSALHEPKAALQHDEQRNDRDREGPLRHRAQLKGYSVCGIARRF